MKTLHTLSKFDLNKINEFFNPRENQIQWYCTNKNLADAMIEMGYTPTDESSDTLWYFLIPLKFRRIEKTFTETKLIEW